MTDVHAGNELDALIAERVMGWMLWPIERTQGALTPLYSTDHDAAEQVRAWLRHHGCALDLDHATPLELCRVALETVASISAPSAR
jgi:hypothetical protein